MINEQRTLLDPFGNTPPCFSFSRPVPTCPVGGTVGGERQRISTYHGNTPLAFGKFSTASLSIILLSREDENVLNKFIT